MFGESCSESPRLPSPWDSRLATPTGNADPHSPPLSKIATVTSHSLALAPEEDLSGHIEYKLRLPAHPSADRLARLTSQLKWRLLEGGGEAIYELGVCDNGLLLGIDCEELQTSLHTLSRMAAGLGAHLRIARRVQVTEEGFQELSIQDDPDVPMLDAIYKQKPPIARSSNATAVDHRAPARTPLEMSRKTVARRKRLSKKEKRQIKRDQEHLLSPTGAKPAFNEARKLWEAKRGPEAPTRMPLPEEDFSDANGLIHLTLPDKAAVTDAPNLEDVPLLSHSPSPPSSTSGLDSCRALSRRSTFTEASLYAAEDVDTIQSVDLPKSEVHKVGASHELVPHIEQPNPSALAEQARLELRRHLRKQWKKERQQAKYLEKMHLRQSHSEEASRRICGSPDELYLDGIASLFSELDMSDGSRLASGSTACLNAQPIPMPSYAHRRRRRGMAFSPTSTPLSDDASATSLFDLPQRLQRAGVVTRETLVKRGVLGRGKESASDLRYAVECIVTMPVQSHADESSVEPRSGQDRADLLDTVSAISLDGDSKVVDHASDETFSRGGGKVARRTGSPGQLQAFIDFETVWDELEMDL